MASENDEILKADITQVVVWVDLLQIIYPWFEK